MSVAGMMKVSLVLLAAVLVASLAGSVQAGPINDFTGGFLGNVPFAGELFTSFK